MKLSEIADSPVDAELLLKAFNIKTVRDLANLKYVNWAQSIVNLADTEQ